MKGYKLVSKIVLLTLLLLGLAATALFFFFGGSEGQLEVAGDFLEIPHYTNLFLYWNYILVALVCLVTLVVVIAEFIKMFKVSVKKAIGSLAVVIVFIGLVATCWYFGSTDQIEIIGYEGTDNQGFMARLSDACLYLTYILVFVTVITLIWGAIRTRILK